MDTLSIVNGTDSYQEFVANIHYIASGTPDLVNIWVTINQRGFGNSGAFFLLDDLSFGPALGVDEPRTSLPSGFELSQNYPNPFNPTTKVSFAISHSSFVTLRVFDVLGREVATLVNEVKQPGDYTVGWNAVGIASGTYLYELRSGTFSQTRKLILAK